MMKHIITAIASGLALAGPVSAQQADLSAFRPGPVFTEFGAVAPVPDADFAIPEGMNLFITFDTSTPAAEGQANRTLDSAARFVNMHAAADVEPARVRAAVVVHGKAAFDLVTNAAWSDLGREGANPTAALVAALVDRGVRVILCGQTAAAYGIDKQDLAPGVELAISAMTAHAVLQRQGYTPNPF
jgi:intracellular sulfur oxidation DsrE/DsrF family protein